MITLIIFMLATIGLTNTIVHGRILDLIKFKIPRLYFFIRYLFTSVLIEDKNRYSVREWIKGTKFTSELFECHECTGFWSGMLIGFFLISHNPVYFISCGFAGSVLSQFYNDIVNLITSKTDLVLEDHDDNQQEASAEA